ncbi:hypothetical protein D3C79_575000 [compost metagenome]
MASRLASCGYCGRSERLSACLSLLTTVHKAQPERRLELQPPERPPLMAPEAVIGQLSAWSPYSFCKYHVDASQNGKQLPYSRRADSPMQRRSIHTSSVSKSTMGAKSRLRSSPSTSTPLSRPYLRMLSARSALSLNLTPVTVTIRLPAKRLARVASTFCRGSTFRMAEQSAYLDAPTVISLSPERYITDQL